MENPDHWLIVKLGENVYKVFATWSSGYTQGDSWKINSGIVRVEEMVNYFDFYGASGSCYHCKKNSYGSTVYGLEILNNFQEKLKAEGMKETITILENQDWVKFFDKLI